MTSQDDLALLKGMHQRGEISDAQYDVLRRHVLWGTPLPQLMDDAPPPRAAADGYVPAPRPPAEPADGYVPAPRPASDRGDGLARAPRPGAEPADGYVPGAATVGPDRHPDAGGARYAAGRHAGEPGGGRDPIGAAEPADPSARRYASRRERREAEEAGQAPPTYLPPAGASPAGPRQSRHRRDGTLPPPPATPPLTDPETATTSNPPRRRHRPAPDRADGGPVGADLSGRPDRLYPGRAEAPPVGAGWSGGRPRYESGGADAAAGSVDVSRRHRPDPDVGLEAGEPKSRRGRRPEKGAPNAGGGRRGEGDGGRRRPRRRSVFAVLTSVVLALALAAGGVYWFVLRTNGPPPATYAREACGAVRDWQQSVDSSNATLITQISRQQNKTTVRSDVTAYYTTIAGRTDQLRTAILGLGAADITGGREYADSLAAAVGDQAAELRRLADRAGRLDPATASFPTDLQTVLTGADSAVSAVTAALARPAAGITTELRTTLSNEPTCAPYVG